MAPVNIFRKNLEIVVLLKLYTMLIVWCTTKHNILVSGDILSLQQNDYVAEYHHIHLEYSDPKFIESFELKNVKPNRTYKAFAMSFQLMTDIKDNGRFKANLKCFRLLSNGLDHLIFQFNIDICQALRKNTFGLMQMIRAGNITTCPIKNGYYYANNFLLDDKRMPPYIPEGRYKILIAIIDGNTTTTITSLYMDIIYKMKN